MNTDFLNRMGDIISDTGKDIANKAREVAGVANLNSQVSRQENLIHKYYTDLGRFLYTHRDKDVTDAVNERFALIDAAYEEIARLKNEIADTKGEKICPECGKHMQKGALYCPHCGAKTPEDTTAAAEEDSNAAPGEATVGAETAEEGTEAEEKESEGKENDAAGESSAEEVMEEDPEKEEKTAQEVCGGEA